ncbi:MAG: hypothetical protein ACK4R7_01860 [Fervidobacterium sp.]
MLSCLNYENLIFSNFDNFNSVKMNKKAKRSCPPKSGQLAFGLLR